MKLLKPPAKAWPYGSASIPTFRGWKGVIVTRTKQDRDPTICWQCPHEHWFKDNAEHCAGVVRRQWIKVLTP